MKLFKIIAALTIISLVASALFRYCEVLKPEKEKVSHTYSSSSINTNDSTFIENLKEELDSIKTRNLLLVAQLDSCKNNYFLPVVKITAKKSKTPYKKMYEELNKHCSDREVQAINTEIELRSDIIKKEKEIASLNETLKVYNTLSDTLTNRSVKLHNENLTLKNEKDSLISELERPISKLEAFPCLKTRKGVKVTTTVTRNNNQPKTFISVSKLSKPEFKTLKKTCKKRSNH